MESKAASDTREHPTNSRVSSFDVRPSVAGMIGDSEGNLDEKKAVAALSQTHNTNKYLWTGTFVLIGVMCVLIATNIGTSVAVARLTRQINVDPVTGMASIAGSDDVVMKTSTALFKEKGVNFHIVPIDYLSSVKTVEFADGDLSFDVKGYARMSNETILLVEGGTLSFDIIGFKNITGDGLTRLFDDFDDYLDHVNYLASFQNGNRRMTRRRCSSEAGHEGVSSQAYSACIRQTDNQVGSTSFFPAGTRDWNLRCGPSFGHSSCPATSPFCNEANGWCGSTSGHRTAQVSKKYDHCWPLGTNGRCGPHHGRTSCPENNPYCNEDNGYCGTTWAHQTARAGTTYDHSPEWCNLGGDRGDNYKFYKGVNSIWSF